MKIEVGSLNFRALSILAVRTARMHDTLVLIDLIFTAYLFYVPICSYYNDIIMLN